MRAGRGCGWALAMVLGTPAAVHAQAFDGWDLTGSNTLRVERYEADGNTAFSPFPHLGTTGFNEILLAGTRSPSPWSMQRFFVSGVLNDSPYRSAHDGFVPERLNFTAESGESALAWRLEAGDFFAFTSLRTLQRSLKGASLELQPPGAPGLRQSLLFFGGATQPSWRSDRWSDNAFGASWLGDTDRFGRWSASFVHQRRAADAFVAESLSQSVASLAGEALLVDAGGWKVRAEAEVAGFDGDHDAGARDSRDSGVFAQLSGFDSTFNWRLRGERYGADYRPFGAVTPADRRSLEAHVGWDLPQGLSLRGRIQDYRDEWEGQNPLDTRVVGGNLSGAYAPFAVSGSLDAFVQDSERSDRTQDSRFTQASLNLSRPFGAWVALLNASRLENDDRLDASRSFTTTQAQLAATFPVRAGLLTGMVMPGVLYRRTTGSGATHDWQPTLALSLQGGPHRLSANVGRLEQGPRDSAIADVATVNAAFEYRYRHGAHEVGFDALLFDRRPAPGERTEAWRIGAFWTWHFAAPPAVVPAGLAQAAPYTPSEPPASLPRSVALLARLSPGQDLAAARRSLSASGFGAGLEQPRSVEYEARLVDDVEQRQRLLLAHSAGRVDRVVLVVSLEGSSDPARVYERVRRALLDAFGAPSATFDEGNWGARFAADVMAGRFARVTEWSLPTGVVRLGIPRRLDGVARIEVHHARGLGPARDPAWGVD